MQRPFTEDMYRNLVISHVLSYTEGKIDPKLAITITTSICQNLAWHDPYLAHKGPSWLAQEIVRQIGLKVNHYKLSEDV